MLITDGITYRPNETLKGAIEDHNLPHWMMSLMKASGAGDGQYGAMNTETSGMITPSSGAQQGVAPEVAAGTAIPPAAENFRCAAYRCAKQIFLTQYKSGTQAHVSTRLMISQVSGSTNNADDIIPGKSCRITSNGKEIMDFYITMVVHRVDFARATADTTVAGKYVRPSDGLKNSIDTTKTIPNPVYEESQ
jgi:hypothetical protein